MSKKIIVDDAFLKAQRIQAAKDAVVSAAELHCCGVHMECAGCPMGKAVQALRKVKGE